MDPEFQDIEDTLKGMRPSAPDAACMERLLAAVEGRLRDGSAALAGIERSLESMKPLALPPELAGSMLATVAKVPFPVDEKVVLFPGAAKPVSPARERRRWYAAAAAVAVAGAFSAFMLDGGEASRSKPVAESPAGRGAQGFVPASVGTGLGDASDEGVVWTRDGKPVRMVRVVYKDRVMYRDAAGKMLEIERPRVEYLMVPEKID
jgi:hypothetical protein